MKGVMGRQWLFPRAKEAGVIVAPWSCDQSNPGLLFYKFGDTSDRYLDLIHGCSVTAADVPLTT